MKNTKPYVMGYDELREHVGHKIELNDVTDWGTNRESEIEIRCLDCEGCEPIWTYDSPYFVEGDKAKTDENYAKAEQETKEHECICSGCGNEHMTS